MKALRIILFILMIISIILSAIYTLNKMPSYLGICSERTILFPTDNDVEAVQKALGISFPDGTKVRYIKCSYNFDSPDMFVIHVHIKLPQNYEGKQFIESYYNNMDEKRIKEREDNENSYNKNGGFVIEASTKNIDDSSLYKALREMSQPIKPIAGTLWIIAIVFIVLYKKANKRYKLMHVKIGSE